MALTLSVARALDNDRVSVEQESQVTGPKDEACGPEETEAAGLDALAEAWIALWQSEMAALAADPAVAATWRQACSFGFPWLHAASGGPPREPDPAERDAVWPAPAGTPAAGAASGDGPGDPLGGADPAGLRARVDELERRLAALERGAAGGGADRRKPRRRPAPA